jgi:hypothetical protein
MSRFARVTSISVLQLVQAGVQKFRSESSVAMDDLASEIRRVSEWIHHECKDYWMQEMRRSEDAVTQARLQLQQARISRRVAGHEPACIDEQRALDRAKRRLERAQDKIKAVRYWGQAVDRAIDEFQQSQNRFATWLETDALQAATMLNRLSDALDNYVSLELPPDALTRPITAQPPTEDTPTQPSQGETNASPKEEPS